MEKQKMSDEKKMKLIYSVELSVFALIFVVLGILKLTHVLGLGQNYRQYIFPYVTLAGGAWFIADFIWALCSKKRREKAPLIDKILVLPASAFVIGFDPFKHWPK